MGRSELVQANFRQEMEAYRQIKEVLVHYDFPVFALKKDGKTWVVQTQERLVRIEKFNHSLAEFFFVISAIQHLNERGFGSFPRMIMNRDDRPITQHENGLYFVMEDPEGCPPNAAEIHALTGITRHMAEMHRASVGFSAPVPLQDVRQDWGDWEEKWQFRLDELYRLGEEAQHRRGDFDKAYLKVLDDFLSDGVEGLETLKKLNFREMVDGERLRGGLCHRDFKPENMIEKKNHYMLLDFDDFAGQSHLEDIARFIRDIGDWDPERIQYIFDVYNQVYAISPEERQAVLAYLKLPLDLWRVARNYYFRDKPQKRNLRKVAQEMVWRKRCYSRLYETYRNNVTPVTNVPWVWGQVEVQEPSFDELWNQLNYGGYFESIGHKPAQEPEEFSIKLSHEEEDQLTGLAVSEESSCNSFVRFPEALVENNPGINDLDEDRIRQLNGLNTGLDNADEIKEMSDTAGSSEPVDQEIYPTVAADKDPINEYLDGKAKVIQNTVPGISSVEKSKIIVWKAFPK